MSSTFSTGRKQTDRLAQCVGWWRGAQLQRDLFFIEKIRQCDGHRGCEIYWIIRAKQLSS